MKVRVIVTGASGALGRSVVQNLVAAEHHVAAIDSQPESTETSAARGIVCLDLADEGLASQAVKEAVDYLGGLDAVVHLAGWLQLDTDRKFHRSRLAIAAPAAIADAVLFLIGPGARAINGAPIPVTNNA